MTSCSGATVSVRDAEFEDTAGLFINTVPVRIHTRGRLSSLLRRVQIKSLESRAHNWLAPHDIQRLSPLRDQLFDHILIFENYPLDANLGSGELRVERLVGIGADSLPLAVVRVTRRASWRSCCDMTPDSSRDAVAAHRGAAASLHRRAAGRRCRCARGIAPVIGDDEQRTLARFSVAAASQPKATILDLFDDRATLDPDRVAVTSEGRALTYRELGERSALMATALVAGGLGAEDRVVLMLPRSEALVVSMLAVLRAGGAFVPIDPAQPAERTRHIVADCRPKAIVSESDRPLARRRR